MPKRAFYYHKFIFKFVLSVFACQTPWSGSLLTRFSIIGIEEELEESDRHLQRFAVSKATSNATCNASITTTYTSHDRFFVYPRFTKGPDIELAKMVASQDQNGYLALPRASSATPVTQDILNSVFTLTDGQLMVSSFLPGNAENGTMYGKVCEINQDIEDPRASVPPLARRSARWKNTSSMIANSSSSDYDRFLCHDGNAWNREPARQWQIQQTCLSKKVADILVPKVVSRADGDILTLENDPGSETIHYCRASQRHCQDQEKSRQIVLLVDYLSNSPRFILSREDCFWKDSEHWCRASEKDGRDKSY